MRAAVQWVRTSAQQSPHCHLCHPHNVHLLAPAAPTLRMVGTAPQALWVVLEHLALEALLTRWEAGFEPGWPERLAFPNSH